MTGADQDEADTGTGRVAWSRRQARAADGVLQTYARSLSTRGRPGAAPAPPAASQTEWDRVWLANREPAADVCRRARWARVAFASA